MASVSAIQPSAPLISPRLAISIPVEDGTTLTYGEDGFRELLLDSVDVVVSLTTAGIPHVAITARGTRSVDGNTVADSRASMRVEELPWELEELLREQVDRLSALAMWLSRESGSTQLLAMPSL